MRFLVLAFVGAVSVNVGLYGADVRFGWWGFLFWAGIGVIYAAVKLDVKR